MRWSILIIVLAAVLAAAQQPSEPAPQPQPNAQAVDPSPAQRDGMIVVAAGTHIPLKLTQTISTKTARVGDGVYAETTFPITQDDRMVIPAGTYVQGRITNVKRAGRVKGLAELQIHFTTLIFPSGYTVMLPGTLENVPGLENGKVKDKEGKIEGEGKGGKTAKDAATYGATGAVTGAVVSRGAKGAAIGGGIGAAAGLAVATLTRNTDVRMDPGTTLEMVLQRPLELNEAKLRR
jgi:type IV secretion system protein VirB10